jgi:hypothetical protein
VERGEALGVAGERPAVVRGAPPGLLGLYLEVDDGVCSERVAHALRAERAPAQRDHAGVGPLEQLEHHLLLARAEGRLALAVEVALDRLAEALLDSAVGIERLHPERCRQRAGAGRLAGPHEAHEDVGAAGYARLQPTRSS